jgi:hypothetical protein
MLLYIRVSVVLSQSLCRAGREELDISLDSTGLLDTSLGKIRIWIFSKSIDINWACLVGLFCHTLGLE